MKFANFLIAAMLIVPLAPALAQSELANGKALLQQGKTAEALGELRKAVEKFPKNADAWYWLGEAYLKNGVPDSAEFAVEKILALDKKLASGYLLSAKANLARQNLSAAKERLRNGIKYNKKNAAMLMLLGKALVESDSLDQAIIVYSRAQLLEPKNPAIYEALGDVYRKQAGGTVIATLHYEQAIATYQQLGEKEALPADDLKRLGKAYAETKRDSLAARIWEEVVKLTPDDADAYGELGALLMRQQQFDKAAAAFEKRFTLDSTAVSAYINYALSNMALSKWELSRAALRRALKLKPDYFKGWLYLARCYAQIDSLAQAKSACEMVIKLAAGDSTYKDDLTEAHGLIGLAWLIDKKYPEALESLNASIRLVDNNPQTRLWRAQALALANRREEAIPEYQAVLRLDPQNQTAKKDLAMLTKA